MEIEAYIPIFEAGHLVAPLVVHIDPASRAIRFEDKDGKRHACNDKRAAEILDDIRQYDRDKWRELERHSLEGAQSWICHPLRLSHCKPESRYRRPPR